MKKTILVYVTSAVLGICPLFGQGQTDADNTSQNKQDRNGKVLTPEDQSNAEPDLHAVQAIRKAIVAHDGLSLNAKNIKVITNSELVVLRGPVESEKEKKTIEKIAKDNAGDRKVQNLIEIQTKK